VRPDLPVAGGRRGAGPGEQWPGSDDLLLFHAGRRVDLYASTFLGSTDCRPNGLQPGYVWAIYPDYDIFVRTVSDSLIRLTDTPGYDAEATISPRGDRIVFTSMRGGDLDIYTMNLDGSSVKRLTRNLGYDGGPFFSPDGSEIVFRAAYPQTAQDKADYKRLLGENLIRPSRLNLFVMKADGSDPRPCWKTMRRTSRRP
jgi:hypothetical protein